MRPQDHSDGAAAGIAAAIGDPSRAKMLYCLLDGRARTSTELAIVAGVSPSTASAHLQRLTSQNLAKVSVQGKHRYYSLHGAGVAGVLESLSVLAGDVRGTFVPSTPLHLRAARTCYDHLAGNLAVALHDRLLETGWLSPGSTDAAAYDVTPCGARELGALGIDVDATRALRRRFAYACLDWSERRPHLGGAIGAALLSLSVRRKWVEHELDSRALFVTSLGRRELGKRFGIVIS